MRDLIRLIQRLFRTLFTTFSRAYTRAADFLAAKSKGPNFKAVVVILGLGYIHLVGFIDLKTPVGMNFEFFYLLGCALVGWGAGIWPAIFLALISGGLLWWDESNNGVLLPRWILFWNSIVRLLGFAAIAWLAGKAGQLTRSLKRAVQQRTARLKSEVEEHGETADQLRETLELFYQVTDNITEVFWVTDVSKKEFNFVSPGYKRMWGQTCESLYASPASWVDGIHAEDRVRVTQAIHTRQVRGDYDEEYRVVRFDGSTRWVHDRAFPVKDEFGTVYRIVGITEDITERKRDESLLRAQRDVGVALSVTSDLGIAFDRLLEVAAQLEGIDCGGVYLLHEKTGELHLEAQRGLSADFLSHISHYRADSREAALVRAGHILYLHHAMIPRNHGVLWGGEGLRALAVVPLQHKGVVLGMLNLGSYHHDEILPQTRVAIETLAAQASSAIGRIKAEELLRQSEANLRTIIHNAPIALIAGDQNGVITYEDGQAWAAAGLKPGANLGRAAAEAYGNFPSMVENIHRALGGEGFSSTLEFGSTVLDCHYTPTRDDGTNVTGFLGVATNVTERVRLERQILEISDREQARLGRDIHDGLCQQLVSAAFDANALEQSLTGKSHPEASTARKIAGLLDEAITESRRVSRGLYPVRLEAEGLVPALKELAASTSDRFKVRCTCNAQSPGPICDNASATHFYRIAQEAVNNALKHSGALNLAIRLNESNGEIQLTVEDDGLGIAPAPKRNSGMGLHTMDYRARSMGGNLRVFRGDRGGTVVSCRAPHKA